MTSHLTTLQKAKDWLGVTDASQDGKITANIARASAMVRKYLGYDPTQQSYLDEAYDGNGAAILPLRAQPISDVSALSIDGVEIPRANSSTAFGYFFDKKVLHLRGARFSRGYQNVIVSYTAGYTQLPEDIELGCLVTIQALQTAPNFDPNLVGEAVPGVYSATYKPGGAGRLPENAISFLAPYQRVYF